ncbi:hypothetical protein GCM10022237_01750 [Nocardioides ginsengisoli]
MRQLGKGAYRWETPHGLARVVTGRGTTHVELIKTADGATIGEIYNQPGSTSLNSWSPLASRSSIGPTFGSSWVRK